MEDILAKQTVVAICYDFDKTLSPKDMQEFGLIEKLNCSPEGFWREAGELAEREGMDHILAYMLLILKKSAEGAAVTRGDFRRLGRDIELYPGVESWFRRIGRAAKSAGVEVEHYIISAGLKEIVEGTSIAKNFAGIYASSFLYDGDEKPYWPCQVVNYTTKTQYLFRISKGCCDLGDEDSVNEFMPEEARRIPFTNMIYIGDSVTDIPAMRVVKNGGGTAVGVYDPAAQSTDRVQKLLLDGRIDFLMPADYTEGSALEKLVTKVLRKMSAASSLERLNRAQRKSAREG